MPDEIVSNEVQVARIYITKYALTQGILIADAEIKPEYKGMATTRKTPGSIQQHFHGKDWHYTIEEAEKRVEEMVRKRVDRLKKELKKLENPAALTKHKKTSPLFP